MWNDDAMKKYRDRHPSFTLARNLESIQGCEVWKNGTEAIS